MHRSSAVNSVVYDGFLTSPSFQEPCELQHAHNQYDRHDQQYTYNQQDADTITYEDLVGDSQNRSSHDTTTSVQMRTTGTKQLENWWEGPTPYQNTVTSSSRGRWCGGGWRLMGDNKDIRWYSTQPAKWSTCSRCPKV